MRILLIEDDPMIGDSLRRTLQDEHYAVDWVGDGDLAEGALRHDIYDLVLLDLNLPGKSGMDLLRGYRKRGASTPVLIISARDQAGLRVAGLDAGADDYLVKPFDIDELHARVRALLRRSHAQQRAHNSAVVSHMGLTVHLARHEVHFKGASLKLSAREFTVLRALLDAPGEVVSKAALEEKVYGWGDEIGSNAIDVFIRHLRKKLGADFIRNVRGVGYKLVNAV